jgi:predicted alpha/beta hydrolase family esterase
MTLAPDTTRVLILPGWQDSGPGHWQSLWEARHGFERVQQADWMWPRRGDWMARLDEVLLADTEPRSARWPWWRTAWAATWWPPGPPIRSTRRGCAAALLVALPDTARADMPPQLASWRVIARQRLPFAAQVVYSDDDPYCAPERALRHGRRLGRARAQPGGSRPHQRRHRAWATGRRGWPWLARPGGPCMKPRLLPVPCKAPLAHRRLAGALLISTGAGRGCTCWAHCVAWIAGGGRLCRVDAAWWPAWVCVWHAPRCRRAGLDARALYWAADAGPAFTAFGGFACCSIEDDGRHVWIDGPGLQRVLRPARTRRRAGRTPCRRLAPQRTRRADAACGRRGAATWRACRGVTSPASRSCAATWSATCSTPHARRRAAHALKRWRELRLSAACGPRTQSPSWSPRNPRAWAGPGSLLGPKVSDAPRPPPASPPTLALDLLRPASTSRARAWTKARSTSWPRASAARA